MPLCLRKALGIGSKRMFSFHIQSRPDSGPVRVLNKFQLF